MEFSVLGPVGGWHDQRPVQLGGRQRRCLLAVLLVQAGQVVPLDRMVELIWGEHPPSSVHNAVQTHVSRLRKALAVDRELSIEAHSPGYVLRVPLDRVDLHRFRRLVAKAGRTDDVERSGELLREALAQWRGRPLADVLASDSLERLSAGIEEEWLTAVHQRLRVDLRLGRHAAVVDELGGLVKSYPMREDLVELWVLALYRCGRQADALGELQLLRTRMVDELGIEPGALLQSLQQRILRADPALDVRGPATTALVPAQLPADVPGFLGRADELAALDALLLDGPMIAAVSGTAGVGKTALAVHWAHRVRPAFPHGQLYVDLRGYDPRQPMTTGEALARLLEAIGVPGQAIPVDLDARAARYRSEIADRRMLVLLDNASSVEQVRDLLPGAASCAVVVTSRDHLAGLVALHGARRVDLDPLPVGDAMTLLGRLIGDRAAADPAAVRLLATRCAQLPLALRVTAELAVSRHATPLARLAEELRDGQRRLRLLDGGGHDRAAVRAVFSWSYRHLPPDAARLFRRLSCHPGPDLDVRAAAAAGRLDLEDTARLLGVLLRANVIQSGTHGRYGMHDLLRAYAGELAATHDAADLPAVRDRLFDYYVAAAEAATGVLYPVGRPRRHTGVPDALLPPTADREQPRAWLNAERANLVAVCRCATEHAVRLSAILYRYLEGGGHYTEALEIHTSALTAATRLGDREGQAHALTNLGLVHRLLGRYGPATDHLRRALELHRLTGDREGEARTSSNLGIVEDRTGHASAAGDWLRRALVLYRSLGNEHGTAAALTNLGGVHNGVGRYAEATRHLTEALGLFRKLGDQSGEASVLVNLGEAESRLGNTERAVGHYAAALALFRDLNHRYGQAVALSNLGAGHTRLGQYDLAVAEFGEALGIFRDTGHRYGEASALNGLGDALHEAGRPGALAEHLAALAIATETGDRDEQARAHTGAARAHDDPGEAREHWRQALRLYTELDAPEVAWVREQLADQG